MKIKKSKDNNHKSNNFESMPDISLLLIHIAVQYVDALITAANYTKDDTEHLELLRQILSNLYCLQCDLCDLYAE